VPVVGGGRVAAGLADDVPLNSVVRAGDALVLPDVAGFLNPAVPVVGAVGLAVPAPLGRLRRLGDALLDLRALVVQRLDLAAAVRLAELDGRVLRLALALGHGLQLTARLVVRGAVRGRGLAVDGLGGGRLGEALAGA